MSTEQPWPLSIPASADFSAPQYAYAGFAIDTNGRLVLPSAGAPIVGVLCNKPNAIDQPGLIKGCGAGKVKLQYGGSVTADDPLKVTAAGLFVTASGSDVAAGSAVAIALSSGSSGAIGEGIIIGNAGGFTAVTGTETLTSGALSALALTSFLSITGPQAFTLPDGKFAGQTHRVVCAVAATSPAGTLTVTTPETTAGLVCAGAFLFDTVGQGVDFLWTGTKWRVARVQRAGTKTLTVATTVTTNMNLYSLYALSVTGTVNSTSTMALPNGSCVGEQINVGCSTAASTPHGSIDGTYLLASGAAGTHLGDFTATTSNALLTWNGLAWAVSASIGGIVAS